MQKIFCRKKLEERETELENYYKSDDEEDEEKENHDTSNTNKEILTVMDKDNTNNSESKVSLEIEANRVYMKNVKDSQEQILANDDYVSASKTETSSERSTDNSTTEIMDGAAKQLEESIATNDVQNESGELKFNLEGIDSGEEDGKLNDKVSDEKLDEMLNKYNNLEDDVKKNKNLDKLVALKEKLSVMPRLSGGPNDIIDLDGSTARPSGISKLIERFVKHNAKKVLPKHDVHISVVNVDHGEIHKEVLNMTVDGEEVVSEVPGVRLKKLREELQNQMAQKRTEQWQQKMIPNKNNEENIENSNSINEEDEEDFEEMSDEEEELEEHDSDSLEADEQVYFNLYLLIK